MDESGWDEGSLIGLKTRKTLFQVILGYVMTLPLSRVTVRVVGTHIRCLKNIHSKSL